MTKQDEETSGSKLFVAWAESTAFIRSSTDESTERPRLRQRLIDLFDAVRHVTGADVVIWERDCPDAPAALRSWADANGLACICKEFDPQAKDCGEVLTVQLQRYRSIDVYLRRGVR